MMSDIVVKALENEVRGWGGGCSALVSHSPGLWSAQLRSTATPPFHVSDVTFARLTGKVRAARRRLKAPSDNKFPQFLFGLRGKDSKALVKLSETDWWEYIPGLSQPLNRATVQGLWNEHRDRFQRVDSATGRRQTTLF